MLSSIAKSEKIDYFLVSFVDLAGVMRSKLVPARAIDIIAGEGAAFAGFATHLDMTPAFPDIVVMPDESTLTMLPWRIGVAWLTGDLMMDGKLVEHAPRAVLGRQLEAATAAGHVMKTGVEPEFFLLAADGSGPADPLDAAAKPCYDQAALMRRFDLIKEICDAMQSLGWQPYQNDHEDANGQFEMNWKYADALVTADRHAFFKFMVRSLAEKHGLRATFMPKPFSHLTGNGCHCHVSLWDKTGKKNQFVDQKGDLGLSQLAYHFLGGVLDHAQALCAVTNPTVNSYKRLNAARTDSGSTWAPRTVSYGGNNRSHMVRIPAGDRFEFRLGDGAANPYLLQAGLLAAGLDGVRKKTAPGKRMDINMYESRDLGGAKLLPGNLLDALRAFTADPVLRAALGERFHETYLRLRMGDWNGSMAQVSEWERKQLLDV